jgi:hypothetical protein
MAVGNVLQEMDSNMTTVISTAMHDKSLKLADNLGPLDD